MAEIKTIRSEFERLDTARSMALTRKREMASMSIPATLPDQGRVQDAPLAQPWAGSVAEGVNALSAKIVSLIMPTAGSMFDLYPKLTMQEDLELQNRTAILSGMKKVSEYIQRSLYLSNLRGVLFKAIRAGIIVGDCLIQANNRRFQYHRCDHYVIRRNADGQWRKIILVEWVTNHEDLGAQNNDAPMSTTGHLTLGSSQAMRAEDNTTVVPRYTRVERIVKNNGDVRYRVQKEINGSIIDTEEYVVCPYVPYTWTLVEGEDYGQGMLEEFGGDVAAFDAVAKGLLDAVANNTWFRVLVDPSGITKAADIQGSENGDTIPGRPQDVHPSQPGNPTNVQMMAAVVDRYEQRFGRRFLQHSVTQPRGDRVTAQQSTIIARELEEQLGGNLSYFDNEVFRPLIRAHMMDMAAADMMPKELSAQIGGPAALVDINIRSGLEQLFRESELEKLIQGIQLAAQLPPDAQRAMNWPATMTRFWALMGVREDGFVKTDQEIAAEMQAEQEQQQQQMMMQAATQVAAQAATNGAPPNE